MGEALVWPDGTSGIKQRAQACTLPGAVYEREADLIWYAYLGICFLVSQQGVSGGSG